MNRALTDWPGFCGRLFEAAIDPIRPSNCLSAHLPDPETYAAIKVIAFGKAAAQMAQAVERAWPDVPLSGIAVCRAEDMVPCQRVRVMTASHPVPDKMSVSAAKAALELARTTTPDEMLLVLVSGGGSALLCAPKPPIILGEKQRLVSELLKAGASIQEINRVRRQLSVVKGGGLLAAAQNAGKVVSLAISDVVGDTPEDIASGPTVSCEEASDAAATILSRYAIRPPRAWPKPKQLTAANSTGNTSEYRIIASAHQMLAAAEAHLRASGFDVQHLGTSVTGEARDIGRMHLARILHGHQLPSAPTAFISGGETTVTVAGKGQGGPNQEYLLAVLRSLSACSETIPFDIYGFAADTDGIDGTGGASGACFSPRDIDRLPLAMLSSYLHQNDSFRAFNKLGSHFYAPTKGLNVNDLRVILTMPRNVQP